MAELALDHDQRDAFASKLNGMGVAKLVRREAPAHTGRDKPSCVGRHVQPRSIDAGRAPAR